MNSVTDGDTEDLGTGYLRRPISVAQLLEREGYRPTVRSRRARRALSGVAAGAVLTLGAVVGSLFLNHGQRTTGDLAASGMAQSGGDIVLAESNTPPGSAPTAATHATAVTSQAPTSRSATTHHQATQKAATTPRTTHQDDHSQATHQNRATQPQQQQPATTTQPQQPTATTQSAPTATTQLTQNTSTSTSTPASTTQPTTTTSQPPTTQPTTTQTPPPDNGLIGGVGQVLGSVTQPVFDWFN